MSIDWTEVTAHLNDLYAASDALERLFPGRKFTLDGHLVGSIGEVIAAYMFDLTLNPASTQGHDAKARGDRNVEIKLTQGSSVAVRHEPDHLIVLHRPRGGTVRVVFNGPGAIAWNAAGKPQKNGQKPISLTKLAAIFKQVPESQMLPLVNKPPI